MGIDQNNYSDHDAEKGQWLTFFITGIYSANSF